MVRAWYLDEKEVVEDQRNPAMGDMVDMGSLQQLGVEYFEVGAMLYAFQMI